MMSRSSSPVFLSNDAEPNEGVRNSSGSGRRHSSTGGTGLGGGSMTNQVAICALLVALVAAACAYLASASQFDAGHARNEAAQRRTQSALRMSDFHARRTDQALAELARDVVEPARKAALQARADALKAEKDSLQAQAEKLTTEAVLWDERSAARLQHQQRWLEAVIALQGALVLGALSLLTRKTWLEGVMIAAALFGVALGATALFTS